MRGRGWPLVRVLLLRDPCRGDFSDVSLIQRHLSSSLARAEAVLVHRGQQAREQDHFCRTRDCSAGQGPSLPAPPPQANLCSEGLPTPLFSVAISPSKSCLGFCSSEHAADRVACAGDAVGGEPPSSHSPSVFFPAAF